MPRTRFATLAAPCLALATLAGCLAPRDDVSPPNPEGSLVVEPALAAVDVVNGDVSLASVTFAAFAEGPDGSRSPVACAWTIDDSGLGRFTDATFTATGTRGGSAVVTCASGDATGTATVRVTVRDVIDQVGLSPEQQAAITGATTPDPALDRLLYPYDRTQFARGLAAPEVMWNGVLPADLYALVLTGASRTLTAFFAAPAPARFQIPQQPWERMADEQVSVELFRLAGGIGGQAFRSVRNTWRFAGGLPGTIYYWRVSCSEQTEACSGLVRIKPGDAAPESFATTTPSGRCVGCHTISADGATIAGSLDGFASPWGTFDAASGTQLNGGGDSGFQALSPDGSLIVYGQSVPFTMGGPLRLADALTGESLEPSGLDALGLAVTPIFSPTGDKLAFGLRRDLSDSVNFFTFRNNDLAVADFDPTTRQFSNPRILHTSAGEANLYPFFSPDGEWVVYQSSDQSQARTNAGTDWTMTAKGTLRLAKVDGSIDVELVNLDTAGIDPIDARQSFEPSFSPTQSGGVLWLVFVSKRQYGNRLTTTTELTGGECIDANWVGCRTKQLWVAAIDLDAAALGQDPSSPAFWLPGQSLLDQNQRGFWAPDPPIE